MTVKAGVTNPEAHAHAPAYAPPKEATSPRAYRQEGPAFAAQNQPPSHPGLLPSRPVVNRGEEVVACNFEQQGVCLVWLGV